MHRHRLRRAAAVLLAIPVALALYLGAPAALADTARARAHFELARRYFQVEEYRKAIEEFKAAHIEEPDPAFLYNIADCYRRLGETKEALTFYRRFLTLAPPNAPSRAVAERRITELEAAGPGPSAPPPKPAPPAAPPKPAVAPPPAATPPPPVTSAPAPLPAAPPPTPEAPPPLAAAITAPMPEAATAGERHDASSTASSTASTPIYKRGWFYGVLAAVVIGGAVGVWAASSGGSDVPGTPLGNQGAFH
jgi:tetratricopeptide (TPR) repeat protein